MVVISWISSGVIEGNVETDEGLEAGLVSPSHVTAVAHLGLLLVCAVIGFVCMLSVEFCSTVSI